MPSPLGSAPGILVGIGVGTAASAALDPLIEPARQNAWHDHPNRVLDPGLMARLVAQGAVELGDGQEQAKREGYAPDKFDRLVYLAQRVPDYGELRRMRNRQIIGDARFVDGLNRHAYPQDWHQPLTDLRSEILTPGELAAAIHRGLVPAEGLVLGEQPQPPFKVAAYPVFDIDAIQEAAGSGYDEKRLHTLVGLQGLPMGPHEAAQALFRGIITHGDYIRAFNTSNMRNEWAQAILEQTKQIPTARDFFENALRGYHSLSWAQEQALRHGMDPDDSLVIYQNQGRPMAVANITKALARGGVFKPEQGELKDPYEASIVEGNLKPAYYDLAKALRYTMPSAFVIRTLAQSGVWDEAKTAERLKWLGWIPEDAEQVAAAWAVPNAAVKQNPYVTKAETQLWTATHKAFIGGAIDTPTADSYLTNLIDDSLARAEVLQLWETEKNLEGRAGPPA